MQNKIKMKYFVILNIIVLISLSEAFSAQEVAKNKFHSMAKIEENQCDSYAFKIVKPLLDNFQEIQNKLKNHDNLIESKDREINELRLKQAEMASKIEEKNKIIEVYKILDDSLRENIRLLTKTAKYESDQLTEQNRTIAAYAETIKEQNSQITKLKTQIDSESSKLHKCEEELTSRLDLIRERDEIVKNQASQLRNKTIIANKTQVQLETSILEGQVDSCIPFASSPGIHEIKIPGMDSFKVLCQSAATGPGWIVIQQRINGKEDFYRYWNTYKAGFGSLDGDFFLGLEKIYQLTTNQRYELYIHLETFNGSITYATYDHFAIAGEYDKYRLINVDGFSGNTTDSQDSMEFHKGQQFHTFDLDNKYECAKNNHGGWWYNDCAVSNLNGRYFDYEAWDIDTNFWYGLHSLKKVQMLIRPKLD